jgi:hypothetical protein
LEDADLPGETAEALWQVLLDLAPYGGAAVRLGGAEMAGAGWDHARLARLVWTRKIVLDDRGIALGQVPILTLLAGWRAPSPGLELADLDPAARNDLPNSLQNRGLAKAGGGDLAGRGVPFVFLSGYDNETLAPDRHKLVPTMRKPFEPQKTDCVVEGLLGG